VEDGAASRLLNYSKTKARVSGVTRDSGLFVLGSERSVSTRERVRQADVNLPAVDRVAVWFGALDELVTQV